MHAGQRRALAARALLERPVVGRDAAVAVALRAAIDVADLGGAQLRCGLDDVLRRADRDAGPQRRRASRLEGRMRQQCVRHRRQRVDRGARVPLDQVERFARLEAPLQHQRGAVRHGGRQGIDGAVGPEQRDGHQHAIAGHEPLPLADVEAVLDGGEMVERHGFRAVARARRVEDDERIGCACTLPRRQCGQRLALAIAGVGLEPVSNPGRGAASIRTTFSSCGMSRRARAGQRCPGRNRAHRGARA